MTFHDKKIIKPWMSRHFSSE